MKYSIQSIRTFLGQSKKNRFIPCIAILLMAMMGACSDSESVDETISRITAQDGTQVGVVLSPDDENITNSFQTVADTGITALDTLLLSGAKVVTVDFGFATAVCSINGIGQPSDNCFGDPEGRFWAFFVQKRGGTWEFSEIGADLYPVQDGDLISFVWTASDANFQPLRRPPDTL